MLELGWRLVHALKRFSCADQKLFENLVRVRGGDSLRRFAYKFTSPPVDPLRAALYPLAEDLENRTLASLNEPRDYERPILPTPVTIKMVRSWLNKNSPVTEDYDEKTLRRACKDAGVLVAGPGAPRRRRYGKLKRK